VAHGPAWPEVVSIDMDLVTTLRYGENPHQAAALYLDPQADGPSLATAHQLAGKELSYNNLADAASAMALADDLARVASGSVGAVVVKHTNACGAAVASSVSDAVRGAYAGDPLAAYGGILAVNAPIDEPTAAFLSEGQKFFEVVLTPGFEGRAAQLLSERWKNVRLLEVSGWRDERLEPDVAVKLIPGGALLQERDTAVAATGDWQHGAGPAPDDAMLVNAAVVWTIAKHLTSNAIAIGGPDPDIAGAVRLFGGGCGQVDRVSACKLAVAKAGQLAKGAIGASDAFFPFDDGPRVLIDAGVSVLVQPGGSKRDPDTFKVCEEHGVTCLLTGVRHFRH
jgi:phosphoribosylaminoimidazolecarboxamide formyltransferase/IMP cyclohydrolase